MYKIEERILTDSNMKASELIEHLKSYIDIAGGDCEVRVFDKINCHTYDIINTCTDGNNHVSLHISSDKYTMKRKHQCN